MIFFVSMPTLLPLIVTFPLSAFKRPASILISVVLPLPFGPNSPMIFPRSIFIEKSSSTFFLPKLLQICSHTTKFSISYLLLIIF